MNNLVKTILWAGLLVLAGFTCMARPEDDGNGAVVPVIQTKTDTYKNVTLVSHTSTHLFIRHSRGVATLKSTDVGLDALRSWGLQDVVETVSNDLATKA